MEKDKSNMLELLREKAESLINTDKNSINKRLENAEVKKIFHELQIYQIELEMQNDELRRTTLDLEQHRTKFTNLFELAPVSYLVLNKSGVIEDLNLAATKLLEIERYKTINKPFLLYIHPEDRDVFYKYIQKILLLQNTQSCKLRLVNTKERVLSVQIEGKSMPTPTEKICYLTITDLTGKFQTEQLLTEAKKTLEIALNASLSGIWEIDIVSGKVFLDNFCCLLCGLSRHMFSGSYDTLLKSIHPNDRKVVDENIRHTLFNEKDFNIRFRNNQSGENFRYIQARAQIVADGNGKKRFIGTFTDISEKTIIEQEAARIKEEQQQMILAAGLQAEEKEKKRISEVLHDGIAQMLYAIKLNIEPFKNSSSPETFNQIGELINASIKEIRNVSFELTPTILTDFGLSSTLEDMAARLTNSQLSISTNVSGINKTLDIQLQLNIFRIIQELINNAIKHAKASNIAVEVIKKNKNISVTVSDNGIGFQTETNTDKPKGIGLSSIKNRLRLYKGTIKIESEPGVGTVVYINLKH